MDPVLVVLVAAIGPLAAYIIAARQFSGKIQTTEASELWKESASIREWSERRIEQLNKRVADLERELTACQETLAHSNVALAESNRLLAEAQRGR